MEFHASHDAARKTASHEAMFPRHYWQASFNRLDRSIEARKPHSIQHQRSSLHQTKKLRSIKTRDQANTSIEVNLLDVERSAKALRKQFIHEIVSATEKHEAAAIPAAQPVCDPGPTSPTTAWLQALCNTRPNMIMDWRIFEWCASTQE
jgi:hypothetical protein